MPIQPRAASLRLKAASNTDQQLARRSAGRPAASALRNSRTSARSAAVPDGSSTGWKANDISSVLRHIGEPRAQCALVDLAGREHRQGIDETHRLRALV